MGQPYVGEIRIFAGSFAPVGWEWCHGQTMAISEYETLFNLIGTTYGGDGESTFCLPDLQGRLAMHQGNGHVLGERAGTGSVTLAVSQIPSHTHSPVADGKAATSADPMGKRWAHSPGSVHYSTTLAGADMAATAVMPTGGSQPHDNHMPYQCVGFIISMYGIYPSPT